MIKLLPHGAEYVPDEPETEVERLRKRVTELEKAAAEVVAELRTRSKYASHRASCNGITSAQQAGESYAYERAADLVAEKLGVKP